MAKSYKRGWVQSAPVNRHGNCRWAKRAANRAVRLHQDELADGMAYKRLFNPWDIHDYIFRIQDPITHARQDNCRCLFDEKLLDEEIRKWQKKYFKKNGIVYKRT